MDVSDAINHTAASLILQEKSSGIGQQSPTDVSVYSLNDNSKSNAALGLLFSPTLNRWHESQDAAWSL